MAAGQADGRVVILQHGQPAHLASKPARWRVYSILCLHRRFLERYCHFAAEQKLSILFVCLTAAGSPSVDQIGESACPTPGRCAGAA